MGVRGGEFAPRIEMVLIGTSSSTSGRTMSSAGAIVGVRKGGFKETVGLLC